MVFTLFPVVLLSQTTTENYIKTTIYKVESATSITNPTSVQADQNVTYFDGLGRPVQKVAHQQSGSGKDIVTPIEYDAFGRQVKEYLPYVPTTAASLNYKTSALTDVGTFYNTTTYESTTNPYSQKEFEASPLSRVLKQAAPGEDWKMGNGHEIRLDYQTNTNADQVRRFGVSFIAGNTENPYLEDEGIYDPSQLYKTVTKDENWQAGQNYPRNHTTEEFKNKEGRIVLKRTFDAYKWHDTYYVYDDYGNLTYVLPPKFFAYSSITQAYPPLYYNYYSDMHNFDFFTSGDSNYCQIDIGLSSDSLIINLYADGFGMFGSTLKSGKILDLNYTPPLPNMPLGDIMMANPQGYPTLAGTAYIQDGDLYFTSTGVQIYPNAEGYYESGRIINLADHQAGYIAQPIDKTTFDELIYQYRYDKRNRLVEKKLPGKEWEYIVYDKLDRPVLTQDANLKENNKWLFTKYDAFNRPVYTGEYVNNTETTRTGLQALADAGTTISENKQGTNTINGTTVYYSNNAFPDINNTNINVFTVNYYDDYSFDLPVGAAPTSTVYGVTPITNAKGLSTGNKVRILGTNDWITNLIYYDDKSRSIYNYSKNDYLLTTSTIKNQLDFVGKILETASTHQRNNVTTTIIDSFTYDQAGRLTKQTQTINGASTPEVIAENIYDESGQLIQKKVGGKTTQNRLQTVDYTYNIRGWLKGINDSDTSNNAITLASGDLFGFQINYNKPSTGTKLYNGNISQTFWKTADSMDGNLKNYTYTYDALNRFKTAKYAQNNVQNGKFDETINEYDRNGNILSLVRNMQNAYDTNWSAGIDNLIYTYDKGNRLMKVDDSYKSLVYGSEGFKDGTNTAEDYTYDANGNMTRDFNKGIGTSASAGITYNHLNLPIKITFATGETIDYIYDASGVKQRKIVSTGTTTDYAGGFQYENNILQFFSHPEGYVAHNSGNFNYIYQYKDHLGNVRLSYRDVSQTATPSLQIVEENNYYPFGLKHKDSNNIVNYTSAAYKYKYNGKELQDELGLNMYDYGARNYDPALGRWFNIDPKADKYYNISPYAYVANNPVMFIDPNGKEIFIPNIAGKNPNGSENARQKSTILTNLQKLTNSKLELTKTRGGFLVREVKGEKANENKKLSEGTSLIAGLIGADEKVTIKLGGENRADRLKNGDTFVSFNPDAKGENISNSDGTKGRPAEIGLAHELIHADENAKTDGAYDKTPVTIINPDGAYPGNKVEVQQDEINVRERENKIRDEQGVITRTKPKIVN